MEVLGFTTDEVTALFQLVAAILKLGNVQFQHRSNIDGTDGCRLTNEEGYIILFNTPVKCISGFSCMKLSVC